MKTAQFISAEKTIRRPKKDALLRVRCTESLKFRFYQMAAMKDKDASDLLRDAAAKMVNEFEATMRVA